MKDWIPQLLAASSAIFWATIFAPVVLRAYGIRRGLGPQKPIEGETKRQFAWSVGAFTNGLGLFLYFILDDYLRWTLLGEGSGKPTLIRFLVHLVVWPLLGWCWSRSTWTESHLTRTGTMAK